MSTHTPGQYRVDGVHLVDDIADEPLPHAVIRDKNERWVALVEITDTEGEANAAFIVRACNAHEELVKALKLCVEALEFIPCRARNEATEAIRLAEGRP